MTLDQRLRCDRQADRVEAQRCSRDLLHRLGDGPLVRRVCPENRADIQLHSPWTLKIVLTLKSEPIATPQLEFFAVRSQLARRVDSELAFDSGTCGRGFGVRWGLEL